MAEEEAGVVTFGGFWLLSDEFFAERFVVGAKGGGGGNFVPSSLSCCTFGGLEERRRLGEVDWCISVLCCFLIAESVSGIVSLGLGISVGLRLLAVVTFSDGDLWLVLAELVCL